MQAALAGGKAKKKKWNKGKMREKINAKVLFDEDGWNRLQAEVPKVNHRTEVNDQNSITFESCFILYLPQI